MLTYRTGAAGSPSAGLSMADHLLEQTLSREKMALAQYYARGMPASTEEAGEAAALGKQVAEGSISDNAAPEARMSTATRRGEGKGEGDRAAGQERIGPAVSNAAAKAESIAASAGTVPEPRRDMHPQLAAVLGIDLNRPVTRDEVASLLNGLRADGNEIAGKQQQAGLESLATVFGLDEKRRPSQEALANVLAGRRADRSVLVGGDGAKAAARFLRGFGVPRWRDPTEEERAHVLAGRNADGSELSDRAYRATIIASRVSISYVDCCFSADKSVSLAWAFAPTEAERAMVWQAHRDAVDGAMRYIAAELGHMRKGKGGRDGIEAGHVGWVMFDHYSARPTVEIARTDAQGRAYTELATLKVAGDPQLHTHVAVPNVVLTETGRVGAIDLDKLQGRIKEFGGYYQALLATNLRGHGVDVVVDEQTGAARIATIPSAVRDVFSKRTRDATDSARAFAGEQGLEWDTLAPDRQVGLLKGGAAASRKAKADDLSDFEDWKEQAAALKWSHRSVLHPAARPTAMTRQDRLEHGRTVALRFLEKELERTATLSGEDLRVIATRGLVACGVEGPDDIDAITRSFRERGVRQQGRETALIWGEDAPVRGKRRIGVTTALHEEQEAELVRLVRDAAADTSAALRADDIGRAVAARERMEVEQGGLRFADAHGQAQREIMERLGQGGRFAVAIGVAGAGKSALLQPLVDAWREQGRAVHGVALAWRQADDLADAGIAAKDRASLAKFLKQAQAGRIALDHNSVVVVDELALVGTRQMLDLMRLRERHGFQVAAVGDPLQCQSVEAGPVIGIVQQALGSGAVPEILTTRRQETEAERATSLLFREGKQDKTAEALERKRAGGTAELVAGDYQATVARVAALWRERIEANRDNPSFRLTVSAPTNADARTIAAAIRAQKRDMGALGRDVMTVTAQDQNGTGYTLALAEGDRVRLFDRVGAAFAGGTYGNIGNNGTVLEVRRLDGEGLVLRNAAGREGRVKWDTLRDPRTNRVRLGYGDVLTIDATQGLTSSEHINAMPGGTSAVTGFKAYVAESRHRHQTWLVVSDGAERRELVNRRPLGDTRPVREADVWANMARNLARQPEKPSALAFLERAQNLRRGAARALQRGLQPAERRAHRGEAPTALHRSFARRRNHLRAARIADRFAAQARSHLAEHLARIGAALRDGIGNGVARVRGATQRMVATAAPRAGRKATQKRSRRLRL